MSQPPSRRLPVPALRAQNASAVEDADDGQHKPYGKRYPRVWTKDAHGGKYSISTGPGARGGYDALEEHPDGTALVIEPGYEKPPTGATTNFVGNHMTQGAIDLAQDALTAPDRDREQRLARLERARGTTRAQPVLVRALPSATRDDDDPSVDVPAIRTIRKIPIERYVWCDEADRVVLTVRARDLGGAARTRDAATRFAPSDAKAFSLEIPSRLVGEEEEEDKENDSKKRLSNHVYVLCLRLHAPVDAAVCTLTHDVATDAVRVALRKTTPAPWPALTETYTTPALSATARREASASPPDLAALRREIIERREGRLAERLPWRRSNAPLALGDEKHPRETKKKKSGASGDEDDAAWNDRSASEGASEILPEDVASALAGGSLASERGAYAEAVERFTRGLRTDPNNTRLLVARARARRSLGCVREGIDDLSAALEALRGGDDAPCGDARSAEIVDALVARGECHAERERYGAASADFGEALRMRPGLASASEGMRRARRLERDAEEAAAWERERAAAAAARGDVGSTAFAKPGMARFEDRGKSGKPF